MRQPQFDNELERPGKGRAVGHCIPFITSVPGTAETPLFVLKVSEKGAIMVNGIFT